MGRRVCDEDEVATPIVVWSFAVGYFGLAFPVSVADARNVKPPLTGFSFVQS